jgi:acyl transferase domain-containing protein
MQPIAIVGIACRFPKAPNVTAFWQLLCEGRDGIGPVPEERWDAEAFYAEDPKAAGKTNSRFGGFIEEIDRFDAGFFGISPREAVQMDPQQRILLELAYEAFEDAGVASAALSGSDTAVHIGVMSNDYLRYQTAEDYRRIDVHTGGGAGFCMVANRLSYHFDLHGPSMAIDSACSSSLVAIFEGCQALWSGQSRLALAGGTNLMLDPIFNVFYAKGGLLAPDSRCKTFSANANGIGRGEGAGLIVLKSLADAERDGDDIYAVIRGGAVNHDGRSNGVTAPNRWAQEQLLRTAWEHAEVSGRDFDYIELHGTGTVLGDTIEANALGTSLKRDGRTAPCPVGSVKSNIGHLEGAAGVAGLIKVALSLRHATIAPSLWFDKPSPTIDFKALPLEVNTQRRAWPVIADERARLAGISAFGLGGTNAHLVLEAAPPRPVDRGKGRPAIELLVLSARSEVALRAQAARYRDLLETNVDAAAVCMTALARRNLHEHRVHIIGGDRAQLRQGLIDFLADRSTPSIVAGRYKLNTRPIDVVIPNTAAIAPAKLARWLARAPLGREAWQACRDALIARGDDRLPALDQLAAVTVPTDERARQVWSFAAQYAVVKQLIATLPSTITLVPEGRAQLAAVCAAGAIGLPAALAWLADDLRAPAPDTEPYLVRCACGFDVNPNLAKLDWQSKVNHGRGVEALTVVVNVDAAPARADSIACLGPHDHDLPHLIAHLDLLCALRLAALADERYIRLPTYPWQRSSYLLPRPSGDAVPVAPSAPPPPPPSAPPSPGSTPKLRAQLLSQPAATRRPPLLNYLQQRIGEALRMAANQIDAQQPLNTMGIDSLTAVEIKNRIEADLKVTVPVVKFLDGFATGDFADLILDELTKASGGASPSPTPAVQRTLPAKPRQAAELDSSVAHLAIDQVDTLLAQLMNRTA